MATNLPELDALHRKECRIMTTEDQDRAIGSLVRRYREAKDSLVGAKSAAQRIADAFESVAKKLRTHPDRVKVDSGAIYLLGEDPPDGNQVFRLDEIDPEAVEKIAETAREALTRIRELEPQMREFHLLPK